MAAANSAILRARTWLFWAHLAAGVVTGGAIFTMSVTGALLALQPQILEWLERDQRVVAIAAQTERLAPSTLLESALRGRSLPSDTTTLTLTNDGAKAVLVSLGRDDIRYLDPYTAAVLGKGAAGVRRTFRFLTEFHRWFAASMGWRPTARAVTGWSTLAFVVLAASGVVLWIPRRFTRAIVRRSLTPAWPTSPQARDFSWHTVFGLWFSPVLMVLALSGVVLAFPWANRAMYQLAGSPLPQPAARPDPPSGGRGFEASTPGQSPTPDYRRVDAAVHAAAERMPTWSTMAVRVQARGNGPLSITITDAAHWNRFARSQLTVSGSTGAVLRWEPYGESSRGQRWRGWARFAHTGELGGLGGQLVAGAASVAVALLVWTGQSLALRRLSRARDARVDTTRAA